MIQKSSNLIICQLDLLKELENIKNLIDIAKQEFLEEMCKQDCPLFYDLYLQSVTTRFEKIRNKIIEIENRTKEIK